MTTPGEQTEALRRSKRHNWINHRPAHDEVLTAETLDLTPAGAVWSVLWKAGEGNRFPISVEKRRDGTWAIHSRVGLTSAQLIGARATPRRRVRPASRVGDARPEVVNAPEMVQQSTPTTRASFAAAAALMLGGQR